MKISAIVTVVEGRSVSAQLTAPRPKSTGFANRGAFHVALSKRERAIKAACFRVAAALEDAAAKEEQDWAVDVTDREAVRVEFTAGTETEVAKYELGAALKKLGIDVAAVEEL